GTPGRGYGGSFGHLQDAVVERVHDVEVSVGVEAHGERPPELGLGGRAAVAVIETDLAGSGHGADLAGVEVDGADRPVVGVGDVEVAVRTDLEVARAVQLGVEGIAPVTRVAGLAGAGERVDRAGLQVDDADPVAHGLGQVELAAGQGEAARGRRVRADLPVELGVEGRAAVAGVAAHAAAGDGRDGAVRGEHAHALVLLVGDQEVAILVVDRRLGLLELGLLEGAAVSGEAAAPAGEDVDPS